MKIRCLIVDDEPLGVQRIAALLRDLPDAEVVGLCENGSDAVEAIEQLSPDLVFLDVQMPELDGFGVLASIRRRAMPEVIFVTAHDRYALKAFEVHAQDYLLKPFSPDRLVDAFTLAARRVRSQRLADTDARLQALIEHMERSREYRGHIPVKKDGCVRLVPVQDIDWIESSDNHVLIHAGGQTHSVRQTLQSVDATLSPKEFVRVHRSAIVNVSRIREIQPWYGGEYVVILRDGTQVKTSRGYRARLEALM